MDPAKIRLSEKELELVQDPSVLLTKNRIISKVMGLFAQLSEESRPNVFRLVDAVGLDRDAATPKISRGENFQGLPWVMLDFPRYFNKTEVMAIRTWFWWGHYFTQTLHLKGRFAVDAGKLFQSLVGDLAARLYYISTSVDEWEHRVEMPYAWPIDEELLYKQLLSAGAGGFIKLSVRFEIGEWDELSNKLNQNIQFLTRTLTP